MQILGFVLLVLFGGITMIAMLIAIDLLLPLRVELNRKRLETGLGRSFLLGLINLIFWLVLGAIFLSVARHTRGWIASPLNVLGGLFLIVLLLLLVFSLPALAAVARHLGSRMGTAKSAFQTVLQGGILLVLSGMTPYIGWFIFTPVIVCTAVGATILSLFQHQSAPLTNQP